MKVTRLYRGWFFPIESAVKTVLSGEFVFVAFLSYFFVYDIEMVQRFDFFLICSIFWIPSTLFIYFYFPHHSDIHIMF